MRGKPEDYFDGLLSESLLDLLMQAEERDIAENGWLSFPLPITWDGRGSFGRRSGGNTPPAAPAPQPPRFFSIEKQEE